LPYIGIDCLTGFGNRPAISAASCLLHVPHFPFVCIVYVHCAWSVRARRARLSYSGFLCSSRPGLRAPLRSRPRPSTRHRRRSRRPSRLQSPSTLSQQKMAPTPSRTPRASEDGTDTIVKTPSPYNSNPDNLNAFLHGPIEKWLVSQDPRYRLLWEQNTAYYKTQIVVSSATHARQLQNGSYTRGSFKQPSLLTVTDDRALAAAAAATQAPALAAPTPNAAPGASSARSATPPPAAPTSVPPSTPTADDFLHRLTPEEKGTYAVIPQEIINLDEHLCLDILRWFEDDVESDALLQSCNRSKPLVAKVFFPMRDKIMNCA
jgi:hypothetical protein